MIMRIRGEGWCAVAAEHRGWRGELDSAVRLAADTVDEGAVTTALTAPPDAVRSLDAPPPTEMIMRSALVLPAADFSLTRVRALPSDEVLIRG
ncbi:hypothetical protein [Streptomyces sp. NPDC005407]|uniref:PspA-associated protein PspAA n=1 Tax=Streptomyces sp. NPDC005407 TaxID=3155340 RepID=UPI0033A195F5